jgi:hypothetical protein
VSNTAWGRLEAGGSKLTPHMSAVIAKVFDWPDDWETNPPPLTESHPSPTVDNESEVMTELNRLRAELVEYHEQVEAMFKQLLKGGDNSHDGRARPEQDGSEEGQRRGNTSDDRSPAARADRD